MIATWSRSPTTYLTLLDFSRRFQRYRDTVLTGNKQTNQQPSMPPGPNAAAGIDCRVPYMVKISACLFNFFLIFKIKKTFIKNTERMKYKKGSSRKGTITGTGTLYRRQLQSRYVQNFTKLLQLEFKNFYFNPGSYATPPHSTQQAGRAGTFLYPGPAVAFLS